MTTTEVVWVPKQEIEILYGPHEPTRRERREKRERRRWIAGTALGSAAMFSIAFPLAVWLSNQPPAVANAAEAPATTAPPAPTSIPTPQTIPPNSNSGWQTVRVQMHEYDGLAKLITDGTHAKRLLPGDLGVAILTVNTPISDKAATVVIGGTEWRIRSRGTTPADNLAKFMYQTDAPVVVLISERPGSVRSYVEATNV